MIEFEQILEQIKNKDEKLRVVNLNGIFSQSGLDLLIAVLPGSFVTSLHLGKGQIGDEGLIKLASILPQTQITDLNLLMNSIGDKGAIALAQVLPRTRITTLDLSWNAVGVIGAITIAHFISKTQLKIVNLSENKIRPTGLPPIVYELPQSNETTLDLYRKKINGNDAITLSRLLTQTKLVTLNLGMNSIGAVGAMAILDTLPHTEINSLDLSWNEIDDAGIAAIAHKLPKTNLTALSLKGNKIGNAGVAALAQVLPHTKITKLNLGKNKIADVGASALAGALSQTQITFLDLECNDIEDSGALDIARVLPHTQITSLNLGQSHPRTIDFADKIRINKLIGIAGLTALIRALPHTKITDLNLECNIINTTVITLLARILPQTKITALNLRQNLLSYPMGDVGASALGRVLPQTQITSLNLDGNNITDISEIAKALPDTKITQLNLDNNNISKGISALSVALTKIQLTTLNLRSSLIRYEDLQILVRALPATQITTINLSEAHIDDKDAATIARILPQAKIRSIDFEFNSISDAGAGAIADVLPHTQIVSLNFKNNNIGIAGNTALLIALRKNSSLIQMDGLTQLDATQQSLLQHHLSINKLLSATKPEDKSSDEFVQVIESTALMYINNPALLDDPSFEKPKRLLEKAVELGSIQAVYLLGNLHSLELSDLDQAKEYYRLAATTGHLFSSLALKIIDEQAPPEKINQGPMKMEVQTKFTVPSSRKKEISCEHGSTNSLVSKTGISLAALNAILDVKASMAVYVANSDYDPVNECDLPFNTGQTIYMNDVGDIEENFAQLVKEALPNCFIPYNQDRYGLTRNTRGLVPYQVFIKSCQLKPRSEWTAEDVCNAIIVPATAMMKSKTYVDTVDVKHRGKPFQGYILSYARTTKFTDILAALNARFKHQDPTKIFIWIDLACVNQHAWNSMKSADIGTILERNLRQQFNNITEGRLIHFDRAQPTNLTRTWCLAELLYCIKAQNKVDVPTEICMSAAVQAEVLAQDTKKLLDSLDSSKARCFNVRDKIGIEAQIRRELTEPGEFEIDMDEAFKRLNAAVRTWLVSKFLPDFRKAAKLNKNDTSESNSTSTADSPTFIPSFVAKRAQRLMQFKAALVATASQSEQQDNRCVIG